MSLLIEGGQVLRPDFSTERADVLVEDGIIQSIGDIEDGDRILDATGSIVIPGLINAHTHVAMTLLRGYSDDKQLDAWLQEDIWPVEAELTAADVRAGAELGLIELIKSGTTAIADMYFSMDEVVDAVQQAGIRARLGYGAITVGKDDTDAHEEMKTSLEFAVEYDGAADGRIRTAFMPHSLTTVGEEYYREYIPKARDHEIPIHIHANETQDEVTPIVEEHNKRPLRYAADMGLLEPSDFLAHGVHLDDSEISLLTDRGSSVIHCPASNMKLASGVAPVQKLLDANVSVGLGTDGAASNNTLDMIDEMRDAALLGKVGTGDASAVPAESVLHMATAGGANAIDIGSGIIKEGEPADLAVIDLNRPHLNPVHDPVSHVVYAANGGDVRHTICDGQILMRDRTVLTLDEQAVRRRANNRAEQLIVRATT